MRTEERSATLVTMVMRWNCCWWDRVVLIESLNPVQVWSEGRNGSSTHAHTLRVSKALSIPPTALRSTVRVLSVYHGNRQSVPGSLGAVILKFHAKHFYFIFRVSDYFYRLKVASRTSLSLYYFLLLHLRAVLAQSVQRQATGWTTGVSFPAGQWWEFFLFTTASVPALCSTQACIQLVSRTLQQG